VPSAAGSVLERVEAVSLLELVEPRERLLALRSLALLLGARLLEEVLAEVEEVLAEVEEVVGRCGR